jgi:hypothetical protein
MPKQDHLDDTSAVIAKTKVPKLAPSAAGTTLNRLFLKSLGILVTEIASIEALAAEAKLPTGPARDLRDYTTLLASMRKVQSELQREREERRKVRLAALTEEELEAALAEKRAPKVGEVLDARMAAAEARRRKNIEEQGEALRAKWAMQYGKL